MLPVVVSRGPNKKLGLNQLNSNIPDPVTTSNQGDADDNLYNFRLTLGGRGN
jgi:hypothetical protein